MKRLFSLAMVIVMLLGLSITALAEGEAKYDNGMTYATGFPITKEPITLKCAVMDPGVLRPNVDTTDVIKYIAEKTNITLEVQVFTDDDQVAMMFASGDYPDFAMKINASDLQLLDAADAKDIVELTPYIDEVCPNWKAFFNEYKLAYNSCLDAYGRQYVLPFCNFAPFDRDLRDMFMINTSWCEELGIKVPTTIAEFTDYARMLRDKAGTGTIPVDVEPIHIYKDNNVGGYIDFFNFFGLNVGNNEFWSVDDGKVVYRAVDPGCVEVLQWLQSCYKEGLIKPESFTDTWNMHLSKIKSQGETPTVGCFFAYNNEDVTHFTPISPLNAENGKTPSIRRQTYTANPVKAFILFAGNPYPYATMRLMDAIVDYSDPAFCETVTMGLEGSIWKYNADGKIVEGYITENGEYITYQSEDENWANHYGYWNSFIAIRTPEWYDKYYYEIQLDVPNTRAWAFDAFYKDWVNSAESTYTGGKLDEDKTARMDELWTDINNYRKTTFANWITGTGDIAAEWDGYVKHMQDLHLDEYTALKQEAYNAINK